MPITPEQLARKGDEHAHQTAFFQYIAITVAKTHTDAQMAFAIPNGGKLMGIGTAEGRMEGAKMKAEGLRPGVPDIFVPVPCARAPAGHWPGLYIEMKIPGRFSEGTVKGLHGRSEQQVKWHKLLLRQGYAVATAYGWQAAGQVLTDYLTGRLAMPSDGDCYFALEQEFPPW